LGDTERNYLSIGAELSPKIELLLGLLQPDLVKNLLCRGRIGAQRGRREANHEQ
jgi:hypothetical protein